MTVRKCNPAALRLCYLLPLAAMVLAGCGVKKDITGTWTGTATVKGITATITQTFKPDGTETLTTSMPALAGMTAGMVTNINYTYTFSGSEITQTLVDATITINGRNIPVPPASGKPQTMQVELDGDTLTNDNPSIGHIPGISGLPGKLVLTRRK